VIANAFDGTSAVIAFFIISGFVIHYPCKNGMGSIFSFWAKRFTRILLPLVVILVAGAYFDHPEKTVTWSLFCELIYYAIYPLLLKIRLSWRNKFIVAWLVAAVVIGLGAGHELTAFMRQTNSGYQGYYWQFGPYFTWIIGLPCWLLGVLIAEHIDKIGLVSYQQVMGYRLIVWVVSCACCAAKFHAHFSYILSMNLFAFLLYQWIKTEIVYYKNRSAIAPLEKMGAFSYSLYLCHPLMLVVIKLMIPINVYTYPIFIGVTVLTAYVFYLAVERPSHRLAKNF